MYNKKGGKVLGQGRDGCVVDKPVMCSTKSNPKDYENMVSKLIDVTHAYDDIEDFVNEFNSGSIFRNFDPNSNHFLPGIEMCYKKFHQLSNEHKQDVMTCQYNDDEYTSLYLNILLRKGLSFQKITNNLNTINFLKSYFYLLTGAIQCSRKLKILLLDIKRDNLLYKEESKDVVVPVFIDFSDDFVLKKKIDLATFVTRYSSYYQTWSTELFVLFYMSRGSRAKSSSTMQKLKKDLKQARNIDLDKLMKEPKMIALKPLFNRIINGNITSKEFQDFSEKQMLYAISQSYLQSFYQSSKQAELRANGIDKLFSYFAHEFYYERPSIDIVITLVESKLKFLGVDIKQRKDYFIDLKKQKTPKKSIPKIYSNKDMLKLLNKSTASNIRVSSNNKLSSLIGKVTKTNKSQSDSLKSVIDQIDLMILSDLDKQKKKSSKKISTKIYKHNTKSIKTHTKQNLLDKIKVYKNKNCNFKSVYLMKNSDLIDSIMKLDAKQHKVILNDMGYFKLKKLYNSLYEKKCKVNQNAKKSVIAKFVKENNISLN